MKLKKHLHFIIGLLSCVLLFTGCSSVEEAPNVVVDTEESVISYSLITATREDVVLSERLLCYYGKNNDEEVSFDVTGKYVDKVYVREGQAVKKGDILCELTYASIAEEIDRLTYQITRNEMLLAYSFEEEELDKQDQWIASMNNPYFSRDDVNEACKNIEKNYARRRELINDSLEFDREKLKAKKQEMASSRLYASMDGTIYRLKDNLEGSTSKAGTVIMTIVGNGEGLFEVKDMTYASVVHEGDLLDMKVSAAGAAGDYIITPYEMDSWDKSMLFSIVSGPENTTLEVGNSGIVTVIVDKKENVLSVPSQVVHIAGEDAFVYTLNENNDREIRYVTVGLQGDDKVEIISGLEEGEKVVKK